MTSDRDSRWGRARRRLLAASPNVIDASDRRRAELLAGLLLVILGLGTTSGLLQLLLVPGFGSTFLLMLLALAPIAAAYGLSRTRHLDAAVVATALTTTAACIAIGVSHPDDRVWYAFSVVGIVLAAALLPLAAAAVVALEIVAAIAIAMALVPALRAAATIIPIVMLLAVLAALLLVCARHRDRVAAERARELAHRSQEAAERGAALVRQLVAISRARRIEPAPRDLNEILRGVHEILECLGGSHIAVQLQLAPRLPLVCVDVTQIEQLLIHLVCDALEAMAEAGTLSIETASEAGPDGEQVVLAIRDRSRGMDPETLRPAVEAEATAAESGPGLGFDLVSEIVARSGGRLAIESTLAAGTTVAIALPAVADTIAMAVPARRVPGEPASLG